MLKTNRTYYIVKQQCNTRWIKITMELNTPDEAIEKARTYALQMPGVAFRALQVDETETELKTWQKPESK